MEFFLFDLIDKIKYVAQRAERKSLLFDMVYKSYEDKTDMLQDVLRLCSTMKKNCVNFENDLIAKAAEYSINLKLDEEEKVITEERSSDPLELTINLKHVLRTESILLTRHHQLQKFQSELELFVAKYWSHPQTLDLGPSPNEGENGTPFNEEALDSEELHSSTKSIIDENEELAIQQQGVLEPSFEMEVCLTDSDDIQTDHSENDASVESSEPPIEAFVSTQQGGSLNSMEALDCNMAEARETTHTETTNEPMNNATIGVNENQEAAVQNLNDEVSDQIQYVIRYETDEESEDFGANQIVPSSPEEDDTDHIRITAVQNVNDEVSDQNRDVIPIEENEDFEANQIVPSYSQSSPSPEENDSDNMLSL